MLRLQRHSLTTGVQQLEQMEFQQLMQFQEQMRLGEALERLEQLESQELPSNQVGNRNSFLGIELEAGG